MKILEKKSLNDILNGTNIFQIEQTGLPGGLIIIKNSNFEVSFDNIHIHTSSSSGEILAIYLAVRKIFNLSVAGSNSILKKLSAV